MAENYFFSGSIGLEIKMPQVDAHQINVPESLQYRMKREDDIKVKNEISEAIKDTFVVVLLGYSGKGYAHPDKLSNKITELLIKVMGDNKLWAEQISLVAGATQEGIGRAYEVVQRDFNNMKTVGIVSSLVEKHRDSLSPFCQKKFFIDPPENNKDSWETNDEEGTSWAIRAAAMEGILGSIVIKLGGGDIAKKEFGQAEKLDIETEEYEFAQAPVGNKVQ